MGMVRMSTHRKTTFGFPYVVLVTCTPSDFHFHITLAVRQWLISLIH